MLVFMQIRLSLRWDECKTIRRVSEMPRKEYKSREKTQTTSPEAMDQEALESESTIMHKDWDDWFGEIQLFTHFDEFVNRFVKSFD